MRNKKRYVGIRIECEKNLKRKEIVRGLWNNMLDLLGDLEAAKTGFWVHNYDGKNAIVECDHDKIDLITQALSVVYEIENKKTRVEVLGISGTIKKVKKKFIQKKEE